MGCWNVSVENQTVPRRALARDGPSFTAVTEIPRNDGAGFGKSAVHRPARTEKRPIETASCNTGFHRSQDTGRVDVFWLGQRDLRLGRRLRIAAARGVEIAIPGIRVVLVKREGI